MKVIHGVSKEGNVICIIQICEMSIARRETDWGVTRSMIQSIARQNRAGARTQPCLTPEMEVKLQRGYRADPNTRRGAVMQILY